MAAAARFSCLFPEAEMLPGKKQFTGNSGSYYLEAFLCIPSKTPPRIKMSLVLFHKKWYDKNRRWEKAHYF